MHPVETFELVLSLLALVLALYWLAQRLKLPPAAVLLVGGGALAFVPGLPSVSLDPQLALVLFLRRRTNIMPASAVPASASEAGSASATSSSC